MNRLLQVFFILVLLAIAPITVGQSSLTPSVALERLSVWATELSASGRYIAGLNVLDDHRALQEELARTGELPTVSYQVVLWENDDTQIAQVAEITVQAPLLTDIFAIFDLKFSPDETLLAVREDGLVRVLRVPTLETEQIIEAPSEQSLFYDELAWSADSRYLAFNDDDLALSVWDRQTGAIHTSSNNRELAGPITAVPEGWIVKQLMFLKKIGNSFVPVTC